MNSGEKVGSGTWVLLEICVVKGGGEWGEREELPNVEERVLGEGGVLE